MNDRPYRGAHPRRTDWFRLAETLVGAVIVAIALGAVIALAIVLFGSVPQA